MGRDKASLPLGETALAVRAAELLRSVCDSVTLVGASQSFGLAVIDDEAPGSGPLGAILSALAHSSAEWNLILACDMPGMTLGFLEKLRARAEASSGECVVPRGPSGKLDPLCAAYRKSCEAALRMVYDSGTRSLRETLPSLACDIWEVGDAAPLRNVNTPEQWDAFLRERSTVNG